ncbi:M56 family metallopeptidase [Microbacterium sp. A93]|uniref:M56 family metallopeptidase n=1 Tax=Microbacterium sp. A93 TaxID=3450716 RepID=UPI003F42F63E
MSVLLLAALAVILAWPVPVLLGRARWVRRAPAAAMVLWQSVALAGGLSLIGFPLLWGLAPFGDTVLDAAPAFITALADGSWIPRLEQDPWLPTRIAAATLALALFAHLVLTLAVTAVKTVANRRRHRQMVELLAAPPSERSRLAERTAGTPTRVLPHDVPLAYCLPGLTGSLTVLSRGLLEQLSAGEVAAVVTHERAHLRQRHDLLRLAFEAWHRAVAWLPTTSTAQGAVAGLTEMMADDSALAAHGRDDLIRAIVLTGEAGTLPPGRGEAPPTANIQGDGAVPLTLRLYRLLSPSAPLPAAARLAVVLAALCLAAFPLWLLLWP